MRFTGKADFRGKPVYPDAPYLAALLKEDMAPSRGAIAQKPQGSDAAANIFGSGGPEKKAARTWKLACLARTAKAAAIEVEGNRLRLVKRNRPGMGMPQALREFPRRHLQPERPLAPEEVKGGNRGHKR